MNSIQMDIINREIDKLNKEYQALLVQKSEVDIKIQNIQTQINQLAEGVDFKEDTEPPSPEYVKSFPNLE